MVTVSSHKRYTQSQLTNIFAELVNVHPSKLIYTVWNNPKDKHSLRLSMQGFRFVCQELKLTAYKFEVDRPFTNRNVLQLERYFQGMYFILSNCLFVFDEAEASMINLMDGDIITYLNNLESTSQT